MESGAPSIRVGVTKWAIRPHLPMLGVAMAPAGGTHNTHNRPTQTWQAFDAHGDPVRPPLNGALKAWHHPMRCQCGATLWVDVSHWWCLNGHPHGQAFSG